MFYYVFYYVFAVYDSLATLNLVPDWFATGKMIKELFTVLYGDQNMHYQKEGSGNVLFSCNKMDILNIDLNNINLDNNFHEDGSDTIIDIRSFASSIKFEKRKALKKRVKLRINCQQGGILEDGASFVCWKMRKKKQNQFLITGCKSDRRQYAISGY